MLKNCIYYDAVVLGKKNSVTSVCMRGVRPKEIKWTDCLNCKYKK